MLIQQGDVLIHRITHLPNGTAAVPTTGRHVLAEGENTGHAHAIAPQAGVRLYSLDEILYLVNETDEAITVTHEEHKPVQVPPGVYKIGIVREYDYLAQEAVPVRD